MAVPQTLGYDRGHQSPIRAICIFCKPSLSGDFFLGPLSKSEIGMIIDYDTIAPEQILGSWRIASQTSQVLTAAAVLHRFKKTSLAKINPSGRFG